jgi:hypothetical protein
MKPIREYLQELPAPYNTLALSVVDEKYESYQAEVGSLKEAISRMCNWKHTPQGYDFWNAVDRWCINPKNKKLPPIPAVEVSPEVEQPKTEMESCLDKKLSDNPTIADSIGSHMQLAFKYSQQLVNENTSLRAQLYRLPILEQENAQLKAPLTPTGRLYVQKLEQENRELRADKERVVDLLNKAQITIAELENQLANLTSKPIQSKEPVYDAEWLQNILQSNFGSQYNYSGNGIVAIIPNGFDEHFYLDPKASAGIILEALAKELNGGEIGTQVIIQDNGLTGYIFESTCNYGTPAFVDAQKAIDILTNIAPEVLKNYFA